MVGRAVAFGDVNSFDAGPMRDSERQDSDGRGGGGLGVYGALQEGGEPGIGFNGEDSTVGTCLLRGRDGEEADVGADVPDGVFGVYELTGEIEEIGLEMRMPKDERGVWRDVDGRGVEVPRQVSQQDAVATQLSGNGSDKSHYGLFPGVLTAHRR
jgi:hypothetical protein